MIFMEFTIKFSLVNMIGDILVAFYPDMPIQRV
ncbi:hypothetical protein RB2501_15364 [Robiginitalea biformata HTCC2501]|uniref:Uncharacterized protein n=1 Tax=Robiginitalea biformata (strain ATCC BAA-864 / DSM 15991 / KCTC 12146 / HTCC2501) TaxID=313596 RepID=A4CLH0_ROBBH|nr:hypothetical protein RB2501_15364 [Robiginitalea biformata HTCC2501]